MKRLEQYSAPNVGCSHFEGRRNDGIHGHRCMALATHRLTDDLVPLVRYYCDEHARTAARRWDIPCLARCVPCLCGAP